MAGLEIFFSQNVAWFISVVKIIEMNPAWSFIKFMHTESPLSFTLYVMTPTIWGVTLGHFGKFILFIFFSLEIAQRGENAVFSFMCAWQVRWRLWNTDVFERISPSWAISMSACLPHTSSTARLGRCQSCLSPVGVSFEKVYVK